MNWEILRVNFQLKHRLECLSQLVHVAAVADVDAGDAGAAGAVGAAAAAAAGLRGQFFFWCASFLLSGMSLEEMDAGQSTGTKIMPDLWCKIYEIK